MACGGQAAISEADSGVREPSPPLTADADADAVRRRLTAEPPNSRARSFDFAVADDGLVVTVC
jgi:hypothetical protein